MKCIRVRLIWPILGFLTPTMADARMLRGACLRAVLYLVVLAPWLFLAPWSVAGQSILTAILLPFWLIVGFALLTEVALLANHIRRCRNTWVKNKEYVKDRLFLARMLDVSNEFQSYMTHSDIGSQIMCITLEDMRRVPVWHRHKMLKGGKE